MATEGTTSAAEGTGDGAEASTTATTETAASTGQEGAAAAAAATEKPPAKKERVSLDLKDIAAAKRSARQATESAKAREAKYQPIADAVEKGDLRALLKLSGKSLTDLVDMVGDEGRELSPEEVTRQTVEQALAEREKAAEERKAKEREAAEQEAETAFQQKQEVAATRL